MSTIVQSIEVPDSIVVSDVGASYTIPAQRYALVRVCVEMGAKFKIGTTVVLASRYNTWNAMKSLNSPKTVSTTGGVNSVAVPMSNGGATGDIYYGTPGASDKVHSGTTSTGSLTTVGDTFSNDTAEVSTVATQVYKITAGLTIVGVGGSGLGPYYSVENYKVPGATA